MTGLLHAYTKQKESWNLADYTDLLEFYLEQTQGDHFQPIHHHVLVDEVQDLSPLQLTLISKLCPRDGSGFFAIGDSNQSIYSFRGADPDAAARLQGFWPDLSTISLTENYRSGQTVLDAARGLFPQSEPLTSHVEGPGRVHLFRAPDGMREAAWISDRIKKLIGATSHTLTDAGDTGRYSPGEIAVLVRFKGLIPKIKKALDRYGIPVSVPENEAFWSEPRVASILGAAGRTLGLSCDTEDDACLPFPERVLGGGPAAIKAHLEDLDHFDPLFWQGRAFRELKKAYDERGGWTGLINWVNLQTELEQGSLKAEKVQMLTLHASKGLEFQAVFIPALEDGILPFAGTDMLLGKVGPEVGMNLEEERRLLYVGMTRARKELFLSHAAKRLQYGRTLELPPSRFLAEIPRDLVSRSTLATKRVQKQRQISLLD
ncbi:MAG: ATP-dependent helicase, partial [Proteobacteria bacterium]|nr:ATP-dependent helicase [Pseudomonadota bacterium]